MDELLSTGTEPAYESWVDFCLEELLPERSPTLAVDANLRFADGASLDLEIPAIDGHIPEWYTWFVPPIEFKYVGMSNAHRATYFEVKA